MSDVNAVKLDSFAEFPCHINTSDTKYFPDLSYTFGRVGVIGDGSCFFHSMCMCMFPKYFAMNRKERQDFVKQLRCDLGEQYTEQEHLALHKTKYPFKFKEYMDVRKSWCNLSAWADESLIRFFSKKFKINILFIDFDSKDASFYCGVHGDESIEDTSPTSHWNKLPMVMVAWIKKSHFEPICIKDEENGCYRFYFDPNHSNPKIAKMNKSIINSVKTKYACQCKIYLKSKNQ
jgi:hypothetical protein